MKLSIVIPAFNEEDAIGATIERTLAAREVICADSPVTAVEVIVVSDGSTDRTAQIASNYEGVRLISFARNRGYGAAIKKGFDVASGDLLGFLDADGTCNPCFFGKLCDRLLGEEADVAIGARMGPQSRMPRIRRIGNRIYAFILSVLSNKIVTDTASGMRVIRKEALPRLYPLPSGMHFTPAMSARILMDDHLSIVECPMPYHERVGESKLHVLRDGVRFLRTILEMSIRWQPAKLFTAGAFACLAVMCALALYPIETWLRTGRLHEDMIYRLLFCTLLGALSVTLLSGAALCAQLDRIWKPQRRQSFAATLLGRLFTLPAFAAAALVSLPILVWLIGPGVWTRLTSGYVDLHWSRVVLAGLITFWLGQMLMTVLIVNVVRFHLHRQFTPVATQPVSKSTSRVHLLPPARPSTTPQVADDDLLFS